MSLKQTHVSAFSPIGVHTQNGTLSSAVELTPPAGADALMITVTGQAIRFTLDGTVPTASKGMRLPTDLGPFVIDRGPNCASIKIIQESASAAIEYQWGQF